MAQNLIHMQHITKGAAGFSGNGVSIASDEDGFIEIPSDLAGLARSHGFITGTVKPALKPLAKVEKPEEDKAVKEDKPVKEDASKAVKGGSK